MKKRMLIVGLVLAVSLSACQTIAEEELKMPSQSQSSEKNYGKEPWEQGIEPKDFQYFSDKDYATDGSHIYINAIDGASGWSENYQLAAEVDAKTFKLLGNDFFRDKNAVYYNAKVSYELKNNFKMVENVDVETAASVSTHCLKDREHVYCDRPYAKPEKRIRLNVLTGADPATFELIDRQYEMYFKDKNNVFCLGYEKGNEFQKLEGAEVSSFEVTGYRQAKDAHREYSGCGVAVP